MTLRRVIAEPLVPEPISFVVDTATEKVKRHKLPGTNEISSELIQAGCNILHLEIHRLTDSI
jgi:hypothetical protein